MNEHRYILELYKTPASRYRCPECNENRSFSRYIERETGEHLHPTVGRCNHESNCGYHYKPKQYFQDNNFLFDSSPKSRNGKNWQELTTNEPKLPTFISVETFKASLKNHEANNFVKFLMDLFGVEVTNELISKYFIGTSKYWDGATVFWQIDIKGKIRTGKIMLYSPSNGKRVKEPFNHVNWVHKAIEQPRFELKQCFFGEHLLQNDKSKPVAIVESEKTAVIACVYLPQFLWLAVGSLTNLNIEKCSALKGRTVTLFPDLKGFDKWNIKAKELKRLLGNVSISDLLESKASDAEKEQGLDLADYLIKFDYKLFISPKSEIVTTNKQGEKSLTHNLTKPDFLNAENLALDDCWNQEIADLAIYFAEITIPVHQIKINQWSTITNVPAFIESHITTIKANNGKRNFLPYLHRLQELKHYLTINYKLK